MAETMVAPSVKADHNTRKNKKPLMEKRRRARINSCLAQLKSLVLQAIKKDSSQFSKLEKADILELTVKHLRTLQRQQAAGVMSQDSTVVSKYRAGFNECAKEVVRYMGSVREVNEEVKERVVGHLASCLQVVNQITPMESLQAQHHQQMKPLHVHIPPQPQPINGSVTTVGVMAPSVIMHTAAVSQPSLTPVGMGGGGYAHAPSPLRPSSATTSPQNCHQTPSSSPAVSANALPLQSAAVAMTTAPTTVVSPTPSSISGAYKLVPSGAGTVAVYVGTSESLPRAPDTVSVDAVPLYSVSLPTHPPPHHHHHHPHHPGNTLAAFVTPPPPPTSSSHLTSVAAPPDCRYEDVSPVKAEYSPLNAGSSLPVDLRQLPRSKSSLVEECMPPYSSALSTTGGHCSPALADDKLWRPW